MPTHVVAADDDGRRIDRILRRAAPNVPPGAIARAIRRGEVRVNGSRVGQEARLTRGDTISMPDWSAPGRPTGDPRRDRRPGAGRPAGNRDTRRAGPRPPARRQLPDLEIIARGRGWLAVMKPVGVPVHGPGSLEDSVRERAARDGWWQPSLSFRPGPIHRLDRGTSGVELFGLSAAGARTIAQAFAERQVCKVYLALASGVVAARTDCGEPVGYDHHARRGYTRADRPAGEASLEAASTHFRPIATTADETATLLLAFPETGRTHQIRIHLAAIGHPLIGDALYGGPADPRGAGFLLHALYLSVNGETGDDVAMPIRCAAPLPGPAFARVRDRFGDPAPIETRIGAVVGERCSHDGRQANTLRL